MKNLKIRKMKPEDLEEIRSLLETRKELDQEAAKKKNKTG